MRFFTRAWHAGEMSDAEAERVASTYEAHLAALGPRLPSDARRLWTEVSLHDGLLRGVERAANRFEMLFRAGENGTGYFDARLSYDDVSLSPSDEQFLRVVLGPEEIVERVRFIAQPDSPVAITRLDLSGSTLMAVGGSYIFEPNRKYSVEVINRSNRPVHKADVVVQTFCDSFGVGAGTSVVGPMEPSQRGSSSVKLGRSQGVQPSCVKEVVLLVRVEAVDFDNCTYKPIPLSQTPTCPALDL